jgi:hypothetical protein
MNFDFNERASDSPYVDRVWRTTSDRADSFISVAVSHWSLVVTTMEGRTFVTVRGPEQFAQPSPVPPNAEFFGIQFKLGTFMPIFPARLVDDSTELPEASGRSFWLHGAAMEFPDFENADTFVARLVHDGLIQNDPVVDAALKGNLTDISPRSVQRRFVNATGLTQGTVWQIERARQAQGMLQQGVPILDTVEQAGYADQPHLTRALRRFVGQTPAQIVRASTV